jgi:hypothetical protein
MLVTLVRILRPHRPDRRIAHRQFVAAMSVAFIALAAAACSTAPGDDVSTATAGTVDSNAQPAAVDLALLTTPGVLADRCPATVVVQTDWFPQAEHGGTFELLGPDAKIDVGAGVTRGTLTFRGVDTGVDLEIRAGGPFLESPVVTEMYLDDSVTLGYVGNDTAISRYADAPTIAVFNALGISPQAILWNADRHPDARTIADIAREVSRISVFGDRPFMRYLVANGTITADQIDGNYKGNLLLLTDDIAHQGYATSEPHKYASHPDAALTAGWQLLHDVGWTQYPQNLAIRADRIGELRSCLAALVPMMQHAQLDYMADPQRTNALIVRVVGELNSYWTQTQADVAFGHRAMLDLGIITNGDTPTFGDLEADRVDAFIAVATPILREQGLDIPDLRAADIATDEFLDPTITFSGP